jgi:transposase
MQWRHLNVFNKECVIVCALPRGRRSNDGKVYRVTPPWEGRSNHFTQVLEAFAVTLMREIPVKRAGQILGESDTRMWRMLFADVKATYERLSLDTVVWVGAEMNRFKAHNYLTVFADLVAKRVLFATPGKDASVWEAFAAELLRHNGHPKAIQHVAIDMSAAYAKGVSDNLGNAQVVYDKFHVIQNGVEACDQVRKAESRADTGKRDRLERTRWMWLKNRVNWTEKETQKWESMALERCVTGMAYKMRLVLQQGIYERKDAREVKELLRSWCAWVHSMLGQTGEQLEPMAQAARLVEGHWEGILAHRTQGLTTDFMEGLSSLFSAVKRKDRGYRMVDYMTVALYFVAGKLTVPCY